MGRILLISALLFLVSCGQDRGSLSDTNAQTPDDSDDPEVYVPCTTCRMFVTQSIYDGNLGGTAGADEKCEQDANKPNSRTYKALIMDATRNMTTDWVIKANTDYVRADGVTVVGTSNANGIFSLGNPGFFAVVDPVDGRSFHTGIQYVSHLSWLPDNWNFNCQNWTSNNPGIMSIIGMTSDTTDLFIANTADFCNVQQPIVCVEQ